MEFQITPYPDSRYSPYSRNMLLRTFWAKALFWAFELLLFLGAAVAAIVLLSLAILAGILLNMSTVIWIISILTLVLIFCAITGIRLFKLRAPFRCPTCRDFLIRESGGDKSVCKDPPVYYVCHTCKVYIDTGIKEGD